MTQQEDLIQKDVGGVQLTVSTDDYLGGVIRPRIHWPEPPAGFNSDEVFACASEVLHHLRATLEHIAYNLVWLDTGTRNEDTAWPLLHHESKWNATVKSRRLRGLKSIHLERIKSTQPFAGCAWSKQLSHLGNRDRHRIAIDVTREYGGKMEFSNFEPDPTDPTVMVSKHPENYVRFSVVDEDDDSVVIVEVLNRILLGVCRLLEDFAPDFDSHFQLDEESVTAVKDHFGIVE